MIIKNEKHLHENGYTCKLKWIIKAAKKHDIGPDIFVAVDGRYCHQVLLEISEFGELVINVVTK